MDSERLALAPVEAVPRVPLPAGFEINDDVRRAAAAWPTYRRTSRGRFRIDAMCPCGQSIAVLYRNGRLIEYDTDQVEGLVLAHLMQQHGWTRETIGAPPDPLVLAHLRRTGQLDEGDNPW